MPHVETLELVNAPAEGQDIYTDFKRRMGFPAAPNFIKTQGHSAAVARVWGLVQNVLIGGLLPRTLTEMMFSAISKGARHHPLGIKCARDPQSLATATTPSFAAMA